MVRLVLAETELHSYPHIYTSSRISNVTKWQLKRLGSLAHRMRKGASTIDLLIYLFYVAIGLGLIIPLLTLSFGFLELDADSSDTLPLPINLMCLCFSLVVFGAVGRAISPLMVSAISTVACLLALLALSVLAYRLLFKYVITPLKKSNPKAIKQWDLFAQKGRLTLRITKDSPGLISLKDSTGANISYRAYAKEDVLAIWDGEIPSGTEVIVVDIDLDANITYVKPLSTIQNVQLKSKEP